MRDALVIFVAIILSLVIGGYLFLNGGSEFNSPSIPSLPPSSANAFVVLAEGYSSGSIDRRTNFRIVTDEEFVELWSMIYGTSGPGVPAVDFTKNEVIAAFDGTHSSGGYRVEVMDVIDANGIRTIRILREVPGDDCAVTEAITSPFQIIRVSKTTLPITKEEETRTGACM